MKTRRIYWGLFSRIVFWFLPCPLWAYGTLSEFLNSGKTEVHDGVTLPILATDIIADPKWDTATPIVFRLCTNGAYSAATIKYQTTKLSEIKDDIQSAMNSWLNAGAASSLAMSLGADISNCTFTAQSGSSYGTAAANDGVNTISFTDRFQVGVLGYTSLHYQVVGGNLKIVDADIEFNINAGGGFTPRYSTHACNVARDNNTASIGTCSGSGSLSFQGVLTHEMGHFLGLSHSMLNDDNSSDDSTTNSMATMFPSVANLAESRAIETLEKDDELGKLNLYPTPSYPNDYGGTISGNVIRIGGQPQRGAHITAFDLTTKKSYAGAFSGISGVRTISDGAFTIKGLPLDTNFALFVEPVDRQDVNANLQYIFFNSPIEVALQDNSGGFKIFAVEGYPDVAVSNVRLNRNADTSPAFTNARVFRLTSDQRTISNVAFYISDTFSPPNDIAGASITFNSGVISNTNPLQVTINMASNLGIFTNPTVSLVATNTQDNRPTDWSAGIPSITYSGQSLTLTIDPKPLRPSNGTYQIAMGITDSVHTVVGQTTLTIQNWTDNGASSGGGGGGCELAPSRVPSNLFLVFILSGFFLLLYIKATLPKRD